MKKHSLAEQENQGQRRRKQNQRGKTVPQYFFRIFFIILSKTHGKEYGSADADERGKGGQKGDDGRAYAGPCQGIGPGSRNITYINAVNDAVHNVDELSEHKRDGYPEHQSWYGIISKIIDMLLLCFHSSPLVDKLA